MTQKPKLIITEWSQLLQNGLRCMFSELYYHLYKDRSDAISFLALICGKENFHS